MTEERSDLGREVEEALNEVLAHVRGEAGLPTRIVDDPSKARIVAVRRKLGLSRRQFAERFHLDPRAVQEWEQGRRTPDQAARVLLTIIEREPEAVERALTSAE
jgi:putative transcriptional regulator